MYNYIFEKINKIRLYFFLKKKNKSFFNFQNKNNKINLIEYNSFHGSHLCQALLSNFLKRNNSGKIVAYYTYTLMVSPSKLNYLQKFRWHFSSFLNLGFKGIYKSFGVDKIVRPETKSKFSHNAERETKKFFKEKINNNSVINYKVKNIWVGDLLYDTYLKSKLTPTINIQDKEFYIFFKEFLELFFYWEDFFKRNDIVSTTGVHSCYSYGIPLRISIHNKIPSYVINTTTVMRVDKNIPTMYGNFKLYSKIFANYKKKDKKKYLNLAEKNLNSRLKGKTGVDVDIVNRIQSSFGKSKDKKRVTLNNSKIKILICTHDFLDSIHVNGKNLFPDFYLWLVYLGELSEKKSNEYDFYIKNHPKFGNKYEKYQAYTEIFVDRILKKYPKIKKISSDVPHKKIINEGVKFVLTVYGSVAIEYAALGIPVINASVNNPHINYNFNINPKNLKSYKTTLSNLNKIKIKINKEEIYECYFMKHCFGDQKWLFGNYTKFLQKIGGYHNLHTNKFYEYWLNNFNNNDMKIIFKKFEKFIDNKGYKLSIFDSNISL